MRAVTVVADQTHALHRMYYWQEAVAKLVRLVALAGPTMQEQSRSSSRGGKWNLE